MLNTFYVLACVFKQNHQMIHHFLDFARLTRIRTFLRKTLISVWIRIQKCGWRYCIDQKTIIQAIGIKLFKLKTIR